MRNAFPKAIFAPATNGDGIEELTAKIESKLPESPYLYPEDEISTQSVRFFVAELVRETPRPARDAIRHFVLQLLEHRLPHQLSDEESASTGC